MSRQQYTLEFKGDAIQSGVLGGSAPEPPFMNEARTWAHGPS